MRDDLHGNPTAWLIVEADSNSQDFIDKWLLHKEHRQEATIFMTEFHLWIKILLPLGGISWLEFPTRRIWSIVVLIICQ